MFLRLYCHFAILNSWPLTYLTSTVHVCRPFKGKLYILARLKSIKDYCLGTGLGVYVALEYQRKRRLSILAYHGRESGGLQLSRLQYSAADYLSLPLWVDSRLGRS
ncbi:hypothetical protein M758_4G065200 [Ceratodon purpureus]|nr:hypothetical protein M758_4G065200 [Ceratodon purpureus]